jgi:LCP family protein required for cell wall assembly
LALIKYIVFHPWRAASVIVLGVVLGTAAFYAYELSVALGVVAAEDFDPEAARAAIATPTNTTTTGADIEILVPGFDPTEDPLEEIEATYGRSADPRDIWPNAVGEPMGDEVFEAYLLVGTDASGFLADAIILGLQPTEGGAPIMVSLPRDLWVWNMCKASFSRLNEGLGGCKGRASGSELMAIMVEDYTGIPIDHLARINFGGFARLVDVMGGISVCVDYPTRDIKAHLEIPNSGCQRVDGDTALGWVRSRQMEQFDGGEWVTVGGSDFGRQKRQQDVLFQLAAKASGFSSPASLADKLSAVASSVRLDSSWSFGQAISAGWRYRGISKSSVHRFTIETTGHRTTRGASVLLPAVPFQDQLSEVHEPG